MELHNLCKVVYAFFCLGVVLLCRRIMFFIIDLPMDLWLWNEMLIIFCLTMNLVLFLLNFHFYVCEHYDTPFEWSVESDDENEDDAPPSGEIDETSSDSDDEDSSDEEFPASPSPLPSDEDSSSSYESDIEDDITYPCPDNFFPTTPPSSSPHYKIREVPFLTNGITMMCVYALQNRSELRNMFLQCRNIGAIIIDMEFMTQLNNYLQGYRFNEVPMSEIVVSLAVIRVYFKKYISFPFTSPPCDNTQFHRLPPHLITQNEDGRFKFVELTNMTEFLKTPYAGNFFMRSKRREVVIPSPLQSLNNFQSRVHEDVQMKVMETILNDQKILQLLKDHTEEDLSENSEFIECINEVFEQHGLSVMTSDEIKKIWFGKQD